MGIHTKIEWCDSTLNLQMGCDGCELWNPRTGDGGCYAAGITARYAGLPGWPVSFGQPKIFPERLKRALHWPDLTGTERKDKPWLTGYPRTIFLNDMGDTFTESLDFMWLEPFIGPMRDSPHAYIILTKRPRRMLTYFEARFRAGDSVPPNFWLLTSVTGPENVGRIRELLKLRALGARVLGVSYEPAWGPVDFDDEKADGLHALGCGNEPDCGCGTTQLDWIIAGGESGAGAKPSHPDWFRATRDACQAAEVSFFFKQWGEYATESQLSQAVFGKAVSCGTGSRHLGDQTNHRVGKKDAGALLDGREWRQMPEWRKAA